MTERPFLDREPRVETVRLALVVDVELDTGRGGDTLPDLLAEKGLRVVCAGLELNRYVDRAVPVLWEVDGRTVLA